MNTQDYVDEFTTVKRRVWREATERGYRSTLNRFARDCQSWPPTHTEVLTWLDDSAGNAVTVSTYFRQITAFLNYCEAAEHITADQNACQKIKKLKLVPRADELPPVSLSREEMTKVFTYLKGEMDKGRLAAFRDYALFHFAYRSMCRIGEITRLEWKDLDFEEMSAFIPVSKSRKFRYVYFNQETKEALEDWRCKLDCLGYNLSYVFPSLGTNTHMDVSSERMLYQAWKRRLKAAGIEHHKFHDIRHTGAIHAVEDGLPIHHLQQQLGHSSLSTTQKYLRGRNEDRAKAFKNWGAK